MWKCFLKALKLFFIIAKIKNCYVLFQKWDENLVQFKKSELIKLLYSLYNLNQYISHFFFKNFILDLLCRFPDTFYFIWNKNLLKIEQLYFT